MIRRLLPSLLLASALTTSGCYMLDIDVDSAQPVLVNASPAAGQQRFQKEERVLYFMWGLVNTNPDVVSDMTQEYRGKPITSFNVSTEMDAVAVITSTITLGIVSSRIVRVEGQQ